MSLATIAGVDVLEGRLTFRLAGAWDGELDVDGESADVVTGPVQIVVGQTTLTATSAIASIDQGKRVRVRVVGGAGGLGTALPAQGYNNATRRTVLDAILSAGGERTSSSADAAILDAQLPAWVRLAGSVADAVWTLVEHAKATWRVLPDGSVWVGTDTWAAVDESAIVVEEEDLTNNLIVTALEDLLVLPGSTFGGQRISESTYTLDETKLRAHLRYGGTRGELEEFYGRLIQAETAHRDYEAHYVAKMLGQNADGTLELLPYLARVPGLSKVRVKSLPGLAAFKILPGSDCIVLFEDGDPSKPVVTDFAMGQVQQLVLDALEILLGGTGATDKVVTANRLVAIFNSHTHPTPAGASSSPTTPMVPDQVGSPQVKAA